MIDRRTLLRSATAGLAGAALPSWARAAAPRPDIVFIMADDLGWGDLACYGRADVSTPFIDSLARDGMRFDHAYANSAVCSPTRVGLITGRYQYRLPVGQEEPLSRPDLGLEPGVPTLPGLLGKAGYQTALVGKWHMGTPLRYSPLKHGYQHFWGLRGGGVDYFTHDMKIDRGQGERIAVPDLWDGDVAVEETGYMTDLIGQHGAAEIRRMSASPAPYLLSLHFTAPHWPWEAPGDEALARGLKNALHFDGGSIATYREMVESLDRNVGRVLAAIEAGGRARNTLVVFTSDNGGERFSKTWPFNGMKGELLEGGIRTPLLVRWPQGVVAGTRSDQLAISMDWLPTCLEAAGAQADAGAPPDGRSLLPQLHGAAPARRALYWRYQAHAQAALREGPWKYLRIAGAEYLFNVVEDPQERANRQGAEAGRFDAMKRAWSQWNDTMLPYPADNRSWDNKAFRTLPDRY